MRHLLALAVLLLTVTYAPAEPTRNEPSRYLWTSRPDPANALAVRIAPPPGFQRTPTEVGSFANWLRYLPLKPGRPPVLLFDGRQKSNQNAHWAVIDMDVGDKDLQQCADSVIRLRAEYLLSAGKTGDIAFTLTNGHKAAFADWAAGQRPTVENNRVTWRKSAQPDSSHRSLRRYLDFVYAYAGTLSLSRELKAVGEHEPIEAGDVFIHGGSPGHVVIVLDTATNPTTHHRVFLLAQGYMPAQEMHVLKNPNSESLSPWYDADFAETLTTPEWVFKRGEHKHF